MKGQKYFPLVVVVAGLLAYHNSFRDAFFIDDFESIAYNLTIRRLWPIWQCLSPPHKQGLTVEGRPFINLSLAINYALGGYNVWGYHALNLTVHILAGLTLLGIVRRTLLQPALRARFGAAANELALATAVLWTVHPLQTESVTYIIQRAESIMGLFYLLTLYCFIRGIESPHARLWYGLGVGACALGMASKEVMVSAPLMVLLYDRAFVSGSFREAWQRRRPLYLGLSATWILLALALAAGHNFANASMNAQSLRLTWWQYLGTQPGVILYYLRLSVWPCPLSLFHGWPIARTWVSILPPTVGVVILLAGLAWAWTTNPAWGFVGAWFFLILAPSSSFVPLMNAFYEHRMYLSLAAVVSVFVMGLYSLAGRQSLAVFVVVAIGFGLLTWRRNFDYRSELDMQFGWLAQRPHDPLAHYSLGVALTKAGRTQEAIAHYGEALRLDPKLAGVHDSWGVALAGVGRFQEASAHYEQALRLQPVFAEAHNNWGNALRELGKSTEAIEHYRQALQIEPDYAEAHNSWGVALAQVDHLESAIDHYEQALRLKPDLAETHYNLGVALQRAGRLQEAVSHYEEALHLKPDLAEAHNSWGNVLLGAGRTRDAIGHYEEALRSKPDFAEAHYNLGVALQRAGQVQEAAVHYEQALRIKPDFAEARNSLARLRAAR